VDGNKTPLYDTHIESNGKMMLFAGYQLPVQYEGGVIAEHMAVRGGAGIFDVSHMGEIMYEGPDALKNLNYILTNDFSDMRDGRVRYSLMCNEQGGVIDDLVVYKFNDEKFLVVVNAANRIKDVRHMKHRLSGDVKFTDISDDTAMIALQGPRAEEILAKICGNADIPKKYFSFVVDAKLGEMKINSIVSRTGYTGEDGFEIYLANADAPEIWGALVEAGEEFGLTACGLGARDTLRLEAAMPLYGHEMDEKTSPFETGLEFAVKMDKEDFVGKEAFEKRGESSVTRVGIKPTGRGIVRENCNLFREYDKVGRTTSGTYCPYLAHPAAMAIVDREFAKPGEIFFTEVRGNRIDVEVVELPFYKRQ